LLNLFFKRPLKWKRSTGHECRHTGINFCHNIVWFIDLRYWLCESASTLTCQFIHSRSLKEKGSISTHFIVHNLIIQWRCQPMLQANRFKGKNSKERERKLVSSVHENETRYSQLFIRLNNGSRNHSI
jgi:hypothetical protein